MSLLPLLLLLLRKLVWLIPEKYTLENIHEQTKITKTRFCFTAWNKLIHKEFEDSLSCPLFFAHFLCAILARTMLISLLIRYEGSFHLSILSSLFDPVVILFASNGHLSYNNLSIMTINQIILKIIKGIWT